MAGTHQEIVDHFVKQLRNPGTEAAFEECYADEAVILASEGVYKGRSGAKKLGSELRNRIGEGEVSILSIKTADPLALIEWRSAGLNGVVCEGVDSLLIENGKIRYQVRHTDVHISDTSSGVHPTPDLAEGLRSDIEESLRRREAS